METLKNLEFDNLGKKEKHGKTCNLRIFEKKNWNNWSFEQFLRIQE